MIVGLIVVLAMAVLGAILFVGSILHAIDRARQVGEHDER